MWIQVVGLVKNVCPLLDQQCVLHQEDFKCEKEIQWVCMAQAEATKECPANVSPFTVYWELIFKKPFTLLYLCLY